MLAVLAATVLPAHAATRTCSGAFTMTSGKGDNLGEVGPCLFPIFHPAGDSKHPTQAFAELSQICARGADCRVRVGGHSTPQGFVIEYVNQTADQSLGSCNGILKHDDDVFMLWRHGEGICTIADSDVQRVLKTCHLGQHCIVTGTSRLCPDSGECVEISDVTKVRR
jgi:hypothetical protein